MPLLCRISNHQNPSSDGPYDHMGSSNEDPSMKRS